MDTLIEFGKILLPAALVLYAMYLGVKVMVAKELSHKQMEIRQRSIEITLPVRLQAYERMTLFLERISPNNLVVRINQPNLSAREFHQMLLKEIRDEYNHNVSQQVYIGEEVWEEVKTAKEDLITAINASSEGMAEEATSLDLAKTLFEYLMNKNIDPIEHALKSLKREISKTY
ncbi:MAG: hypothetical protein ABFS32_05650 [Bacteroidota bacterium]